MNRTKHLRCERCSRRTKRAPREYGFGFCPSCGGKWVVEQPKLPGQSKLAQGIQAK